MTIAATGVDHGVTTTELPSPAGTPLRAKPPMLGEIRFCPRCDKTVAVDVQEKWKGALRDGRQIVVTCRPCGLGEAEGLVHP